MAPQLPVFPAEDHVCEPCVFRYADLSCEHALSLLSPLPGEIRRLVTSAEPAQLTVRTRPEEWSVAEYLCHIRDVFMTSTIRLHRTRKEDNPRLDPMLNDLRVRRFRYNDWQVAAVLDDRSMQRRRVSLRRSSVSTREASNELPPIGGHQPAQTRRDAAPDAPGIERQ
jgi:hypothetical protein